MLETSSNINSSIKEGNLENEGRRETRTFVKTQEELNELQTELKNMNSVLQNILEDRNTLKYLLKYVQHLKNHCP